MQRSPLRGALRGALAVLCLCLGLCLTAPLSAQVADLASGPGDIPAQFPRTTEAFDYVRTEAMIRMRDGVKLFTVIMAPKHAAEALPIILTRTPYNAARRSRPQEGGTPSLAMSFRSAADEEALVSDGFIRVNQDVRGRHKSEGIYITGRPLRGALNATATDHSTDTWDTIEWLVRNVPGNNGRVGITGISYDGFLTLMALVDPHPALKAALSINPMVDGWRGDDWYHNGALRQMMVEWIYTYTSTREDDLEIPYGYHDVFTAFLNAGSAAEAGRRYNADRLPAWRRIIDNPAYSSLWQEQALQKHLAGLELKVPTMTVHSLYDQEDIFGAPASYAALEQRDARNDMNFLVIGPWYHAQTREEGTGLGSIKWNSDTARYFRDKVRRAFWNEHLKGKVPKSPLPPVLAFETGTNEWHAYPEWPPKSSVSRKLFLHAQAGLNFDPPTRGADSYTEYVADPAKPVPFRPRPIRDTNDESWRTWLAQDQRAVTDRPDVVSFVSAPLEAPLTVRGQPTAHLFASTSGTDADWVIKLIDGYPDEYPSQPELGGYQLMISGDIFRGRYRESFELARPIPAGKVLPYRIALPHVNHTFLPGHRIIVQIQSSWFPLYDRNPQRFVANIAYAKPEELTRATQRIHHAPGAATFIELPVAADAAVTGDSVRTSRGHE